MVPPAKRRKRAIVDDDSDDDQEDKNKNTLRRFLVPSPNKSQANKSPTKLFTTATSSSHNAPTADSPNPSPIRKTTTRAATACSLSSNPPTPTTRSPSTSPLKSRTRAGTQRKRKAAETAEQEKKPKSADLLTLFSKQAQRSQSHDPISENGGDKVEDDDDDVPLMVSSAAAASSLVGRAQAAHRRFAGKGNGSAVVGSQQRGGIGTAATQSTAGGRGAAGGGGQRFILRAGAIKTTTTAAADNGDGARPWSERFAPTSLDELAVHKRKVQDVRRWLDEVFAGRMRQRLLVLKGPAGSGKTTTLRLLAREVRCDVLEWRNPASSFGVTGHGYQSAAAQFEEFLGRGGKFGQLDVESDGATPPPMGPPPPPSGKPQGAERRLILVEEFPNTFMRSSAGLVAFRNAILQFLAANTPTLAGLGFGHNSEPVTPIVMVISETLLTTTSASADSFTAHRLLGPEILKHPGTGVIEFNPVAPTFLTKALELVVQKEARKSGRRRTPGPLVLQRLGEIGDIRNAISSLEFLCVKGDSEADWGSKVAFTKPKRGSKDIPALTKGEQDSLELISQREATLGIFHAVGKVVYNKRGDYPAGSPEAAAEVLPDYMSHLARPKRSEVAVDALIDEIGTDTHTFISALHENYALSCEQSSPLDHNSSLDYINGCLDYLSGSDLLYPSWDIFFGGRGFGGGGGGGGYSGKDSGSHILRQDEMAFQVAVRGLLFSLPSPEELEELVDMWANKMLKGEDGGPGPPPQPLGYVNDGSSAFRKTNGSKSGLAGNQVARQVKKLDEQDHSHPQPLLSLGNAARQELLLERLPYMAQIARRKRCTFGTMRIRDLDKVVSFQGIGSLGAGEDEGEDGPDEESGGVAGAAESWATDKPTEEGSPRKRRGLGAILSGRAGRGKNEMEEAPSLPMQSLVISDDDIEDD
ncbi:Rad17-domain-containing protein [Parathielavia appendiculata]|uniref:Rad17-domain-containing protein n=1 Tax=Parathielavia appendiculata TaxID=2587402 RepID=A0AAN6Z7H1_9PEZI|nr:Rad17-domain-containing protein [Parathielavia appendiculata]